jgi:AcrR family transcriptional regulator
MAGQAQRRQVRTEAVNNLKRGLILDAARRVFERDGLDGASLRGIALEAGYTPAALYFHFESKEAIYAELLNSSLENLAARVTEGVARAQRPRARLRAAALAFFEFYAQNPRDLDLGFYLFRGGMRPKGLGRSRDRELNARLGAALRPIATEAAALGASPEEANLLVVDTFAHAAGLLLLAHTGRIRMFSASANALFERYVDERIERLEHKRVTP